MPELYGKITLADQTIEFSCEDGLCEYTITLQREPGHTSHMGKTHVPQEAFLKALAIAVHNDGMPDYRADYPDAEAVQLSDPEFRFIP